ncbi:MAG: SDR family NAD(P)-dependent oxidoreductase [Myxococcota bacterium]
MRVIAGQTALVTGAGRGIGRATAEALLREGAKVALTDRDEDVVQEAAAALQGLGPARAFALDVRDPAAFRQVVEDVGAALAPVDILVNNAGIMSLGGFLEQDPLLDDRQIDVNLRGVLHGVRAALPGMIARGHGHVVNVASVAGVVGVPYSAVYAATKHAVVGLTEALHNELARSDLDLAFSYVLPSIVQTELTAGTRSLRYPPPVKPEDVAQGVVRALRTGRVDVWVPRFGRTARILPALLPRRVQERLGELFGVDRVFDGIDEAARAAYQARIRR